MTFNKLILFILFLVSTATQPLQHINSVAAWHLIVTKIHLI